MPCLILGNEVKTRFPKMRVASFEGLQLPYLPVHQTSAPETLVEVPAEAVAAEKLVLRAEHSEGIVELARPRKTVEEAEVEEVAEAEVGNSAEVGREAVVGGFLRSFLACGALAGKIRLRFALRIGTMLGLPVSK